MEEEVEENMEAPIYVLELKSTYSCHATIALLVKFHASKARFVKPCIFFLFLVYESPSHFNYSY